MPSTREPSVEELREESERSRDALASTVGELRDTVGDTAAEMKTLISPAHIKQEIKNYVREERESVVQSIQRRAQDNPLQMAAIGAAVAYPVWSLLRAIPTPLLLIGAGLFLTSKRGQQSAKDIKAKVDDVVQQGTEKVPIWPERALRSRRPDRRRALRRRRASRYGHIRRRLCDRQGTCCIPERRRYRERRRQRCWPARPQQQRESRAQLRPAQSAADREKSRRRRWARPPRAAVTQLRQRQCPARRRHRRGGRCVYRGLDPISDAENRLFGAGSEKLKDKAREAAAQGIEQAGNIAAEAAGSVAAAAAREGLDASGIQRALNTVADSVRKVADRGLETALGTDAEAERQQPITQRNAI